MISCTYSSAGVSKRAMNEDLAQPLRDAIIAPMVKRGADGVSDSVQVSNWRTVVSVKAPGMLRSLKLPTFVDRS